MKAKLLAALCGLCTIVAARAEDTPAAKNQNGTVSSATNPAQAADPESWRENCAYTLAYQAYLLGYPYVNMPAYRYAFVAAPRANDQSPSAPLNHFYHFRIPPDARYQGGGGTNNDTLYSTAWPGTFDEFIE